jgi:ATP-dependent protease ClpP protease subunit
VWSGAHESIGHGGRVAFVKLVGEVTQGRIRGVLRSAKVALGTGARALVLEINSPGGSVRAGFLLVQTLQELRARHVPVIASVPEGQASSMASLIAVSCDFALMGPSATMTIHEPQEASPSKVWAHFRELSLQVYEARTLVDRDRLASWLAADVTMSAEEACRFGFVDEVAFGLRVARLARAAASTGLGAPVFRSSAQCRRAILHQREETPWPPAA